MNLKQFKKIISEIPEEFDDYNFLTIINNHYSDFEWHGQFPGNSDLQIFTGKHPNPYPHQKEKCIWLSNCSFQQVINQNAIFKDRK